MNFICAGVEIWEKTESTVQLKGFDVKLKTIFDNYKIWMCLF